MKELIKVTMNDNQQLVDARELHQSLESKKQFGNWIANKVINNPFFTENEDWTVINQSVKNPQGGRPTKDYALTLDTAKKVSMSEQTNKGNEVRDYFITMEKKAIQLVSYQIQDPIKRAEAWIEEQKEKLLLAESNEAKQKTIDILTHSLKVYNTTEIAKELGFNSAQQLNTRLNELGIQYKTNKTWVLYSKYAHMDLVSIKEQILDSGKVVYDRKWTDAGRLFLIERVSS